MTKSTEHQPESMGLLDSIRVEAGYYEFDRVSDALNRHLDGLVPYCNDISVQAINERDRDTVEKTNTPQQRLSNALFQKTITVLEIYNTPRGLIMSKDYNDLGSKNGPVQRGEFGNKYNDLVDDMMKPLREIGRAVRYRVEEEAYTENVYDLNDPEQLDFVALFLGKKYAKDAGVEALLQDMVELPEYAHDTQPQDPANPAGVYLDEHGKVDKIMFSTELPGVYKILKPNGKGVSLGMKMDPEIAGSTEMQLWTNESIPTFAHSEAAKDILNRLEREGIMPPLTGKLNQLFIGQHKGTYGSVYAEMTREIAKLVGQPNRDIDMLFGYDESGLSEAALTIKERIANIDVDDLNGPAQVVLRLLKQVAGRQSYESDIPVYDGEVRIRENNCKDSETYFLISEQNELQVYGAMLHKTRGKKTAVNVSPVRYNGVLLPVGSLFQVYEDEQGNTSYAFVRVTEFAFDENEARDAFTWQAEETKHNSGQYPSRDALERLTRSIG